jgi:hypothetical protein
MKKQILLMVTITTLAATGPTLAEEASPGGFQVGILTCSSTPESQKNLIVASSVALDCELKYNDGEVDYYSGKSGIAAGLDLNWKRSDVLKYAVLAASQDTTPGAGALAGRFVGGKGSVTLGYGGGAGALVGGSDSNLTLQPLALEGSKGLGVAAGVSYLTLEHKPSE